MGQSYRLNCRGCQKRMLMLKSTGSELFDEAYFILNERFTEAPCGEADMINEANRIISENLIVKSGAGTLSGDKTKTAPLAALRWFICGALSGAGVLAVIWSVIGM
ncbi:MAG: hypothetical protein WCQ72_07605 [Eubacteriales bacterium]